MTRFAKHVEIRLFIGYAHVNGEAEYLFAPYSVFTVRSFTAGKGKRPTHRIEIDPLPDNKGADADLPLAPWY